MKHFIHTPIDRRASRPIRHWTYMRFIVACLAFLCLFVVTTAALAERLKATPNARLHFQAGLAHVDDPAGPKYEEAYREFKAAYADTPSYEIALNHA